jgi:hypothetical protein
LYFFFTVLGLRMLAAKDGLGSADFGSMSGYFSTMDALEAARGRECCSPERECCSARGRD